MNKPVNAKYFYENGEVCDTGVHMGLGQVRRAGIVHTDGAPVFTPTTNSWLCVSVLVKASGLWVTDMSRRKLKAKSSSPKPTNSALYSRVKAAAKKKFDVYPSAYANAWLVREYKKRGGGYR